MKLSLDDLMETDSSDSMSFNQILKAKEVHIFGTCRTANLKNEGIKLIKKLAVPHTNLYYIERSQTNEEKNVSIYTQPANYTTKLTDIYDSIKYLTTTESERYIEQKSLSQYEDYENWYFGHILNPRAREERQKDFKKGKEMLCDYVFRETPTPPNFYELIFNLTHFSWTPVGELGTPYVSSLISQYVNIIEAYEKLLFDIKHDHNDISSMTEKSKLFCEASTELFVLFRRHCINCFIDLVSSSSSKNPKDIMEEALKEQSKASPFIKQIADFLSQSGYKEDFYNNAAEIMYNRETFSLFASYFFTFREIVFSEYITSNTSVFLPCNTHPLQREHETLFKTGSTECRENIPKFPKIKFDLCVFEIWNIDEYRINAGLFDGLNVPFKPQSPHRLYPNYLIDKTTLSEDEAWKLLKEMSDMVGNCPILIIGPYLSPTLGDKVNIKRRKTQDTLKTLVKKLPRTEYFDLTHEIEKDSSILIQEPGSDGHETHLTEKGEIIITNIILSFINKHLPDDK